MQWPQTQRGAQPHVKATPRKASGFLDDTDHTLLNSWKVYRCGLTATAPPGLGPFVVVVTVAECKKSRAPRLARTNPAPARS